MASFESRARISSPAVGVRLGGRTAEVGETKVSSETRGQIKTEIHLDDIQQIQGFDFVDDVTLDLDLALRDGDLSFANVYSGLPIKRLEGRHSTEVRILAAAGKLRDGSHFKTKLDNVDLATADVGVTTDAVIEVGANHDLQASIVHLTPLEASFRNTVVNFDGDRSKRFAATLTSNSARWLTETPASAFQATVDVQATPGNAFLEAALGKTPAAITEAFLDLPRLTARVAVYLNKESSRVELLALDAGDLKASGVWQDRPRGSTGGFAVKTPVVDIGVALNGGSVSWDLE